jgi:hypothetical protein
MYTSTNGVEDERGRTSEVKENSKRRVVHTHITMRKKSNTIIHSLFSLPTFYLLFFL